MSIKLSAALREGMLVSGSLRDQFSGAGEIRLYSGPEPVSADTAIGGTNVLLCTIKADAGVALDLATTAPGGTVTKDPDQVWQGTVGTSGVATFFRYVIGSDTDAVGSFPRIQGGVGAAGADMYLSNTSLTSGAVQKLEAFALSLPEV